MAFVVLPVIKQFLLCDDVVGDPVSGKPHLVNLFDAVRAPHGAEWPYTLNKACLFAWLREGMGRVTFRFELSRLRERNLLGESSEHQFHT